MPIRDGAKAGKSAEDTKEQARRERLIDFVIRKREKVLRELEKH